MFSFYHLFLIIFPSPHTGTRHAKRHDRPHYEEDGRCPGPHQQGQRPHCRPHVNARVGEGKKEKKKSVCVCVYFCCLVLLLLILLSVFSFFFRSSYSSFNPRLLLLLRLPSPSCLFSLDEKAFLDVQTTRFSFFCFDEVIKYDESSLHLQSTCLLLVYFTFY